MLDSSGARISAARISVLGTDLQTATDSSGQFSLAGLRAGSHALLVQKLAFESRIVEVTVAAGGSADLLVDLVRTQKAGVLLDTVVTRAASPAGVGVEDALRRARFGIGQLITRSQIEAHPGATASSLLRSTAQGVKYVRHCVRGYALAGVGDGSMSITSLRTAGCVMPAECYMQIFQDGLRLYSYDGRTVPPSFDELRLQDVEAIEVFRGTDTPAEYRSTGAACGTVLIWLRR